VQFQIWGAGVKEGDQWLSFAPLFHRFDMLLHQGCQIFYPNVPK
jgi:hypothetical protein